MLDKVWTKYGQVFDKSHKRSNRRGIFKERSKVISTPLLKQTHNFI